MHACLPEESHTYNIGENNQMKVEKTRQMLLRKNREY